MTAFIVAILLIVLALLALTLLKTYFYLPYRELKRQAERGDELARTLFRAASYGSSLKLLLWFVMGVSAALGFVLFARVAPPLLGLLVVALVLWFAFLWLPGTHLTSAGARLAVWCTPVVAWLLGVIHPLTHRIASVLSRFPAGPHTGLYEREDILEFIDQQQRQSDSRIDERDLELMRGVLQFGGFKVRDILVPRKNVTAVSVDESIGPVLLDEMHASKHHLFPVYDGNADTTIVGTLELRTVVDVKHGGKVRDYYDRHVVYVHENDNLAQALRAVYDTKRPLFIVINSFDEYLGIITVKDILQKLIPAEPAASDHHHEDRQAVAARHAKKQQA